MQDKEDLESKKAELESKISELKSKVEQEHSTLVELLKTSDQARPTDFSSSGWYLKLTHGFIKDAQSVDKVLRGQILDAIADIYKKPTELHGDTVKPYTASLKGLWRYRIGDYRLKYQPDSVHKCYRTN